MMTMFQRLVTIVTMTSRGTEASLHTRRSLAEVGKTLMNAGARAIGRAVLLVETSLGRAAADTEADHLAATAGAKAVIVRALHVLTEMTAEAQADIEAAHLARMAHEAEAVIAAALHAGMNEGAPAVIAAGLLAEMNATVAMKGAAEAGTAAVLLAETRGIGGMILEMNDEAEAVIVADRQQGIVHVMTDRQIALKTTAATSRNHLYKMSTFNLCVCMLWLWTHLTLH